MSTRRLTVKAAIRNSISTITHLPFEPLVTGPLLLVLLRGPDKVRNYLVSRLNTTPGLRRIEVSRFITILKILLAYGVVKYTNALLNSIALNNWRLRKAGTPWDFPNEIVVITGGASGFGKLIAEKLAVKVKKVVVLDVQDPPKEFENNTKIAFYNCDITKKSELHEVASSIRREYGSPSILINNAGIVKWHTTLDAPEDYLRRVFDVNTISHWFTVQEFLPDMLTAKKGHVVTICSTASYVSTAKISAYSATKASALAFHEGLNSELQHYYPGGRSIQTTSVHPTWADTPLLDRVKPSLDKTKVRVLPPEVVPDAIVKQVLSGRGGQLFVPPSEAIVSNLRGWPNWLQELLRGPTGKVLRDAEG